jgi:SAM-dependent methyltransferase
MSMGGECCFCGGHVRLRYKNQFHKMDTTFGPFDFGECDDCGSGITLNPPSPERLALFYSDYAKWRPDFYKAADRELDAQYQSYAARILPLAPSGTWLDIGGGFGEVANLIARRNANGTMIDIGPRPAGLTVDYRSVDLNNENWELPQFDFVYSVAVLEHVLHPDQFIAQSAAVVRPGGHIAVICPDYGSLARRLLGSAWPYYLPGEHLNIPSREGMRRNLARAGLDDVRVCGMTVDYNLRYALAAAGISAIKAPNVSLPMPTGILCATARATASTKSLRRIPSRQHPPNAAASRPTDPTALG